MVGVKVNGYADKVYNTLRTIYKHSPRSTEKVLYPKDLKNITPVQRSILAELDSSTYTADKRHIHILGLYPEFVKSINLLIKQM